jgi:hypothetical protein
MYDAQRCDVSVAYAGISELGPTCTYGVMTINDYSVLFLDKRLSASHFFRSHAMLHWQPNTSRCSLAS